MIYDLIGLGIGPFNLSLAALLEENHQISNIFFDKKLQFNWHSDLMFNDSIMQTHYLTDLVTPVNPSSKFSFLNYLHNKNLFYHFLNTERMYVSRMEFEQYCQWVSEKLAYKLNFNSEVQHVSFDKTFFKVETSLGEYYAKNICVATGLVPRIPECAIPYLGPNVFYANSPELRKMDVTNKSVTIVGGGQTGIEVFNNILNDKWGRAKSLRLVTARNNLESFDESPFTSEYFTPAYLETFWNFNHNKKSQIVAKQHLLSDGNTPSYLLKVYNNLYQKRFIEHDTREISILACRKLINMEALAQGFRLTLSNSIHECNEMVETDIVILSTGSQTKVPDVLEPLFPVLQLDSEGRFVFNKSYSVAWDGPNENKIYALNFSRHQHGIIDPQTNLMAWRSATIINDITNKQIYNTNPVVKNFVEYDRYIA